MNPELKLCYIDGAWAYFTSQALADQTGDDWNDAPYEHNAGSPYVFEKYDAEKGRAPWEIVKLAWDSPHLSPPADYPGSPIVYSVDQINAGAVPWLVWLFDRSKAHIRVMAGCDVWEFTEKVIASGGMVYWPFDKIASEIPR